MISDVAWETLGKTTNVLDQDSGCP